MPNPWLNQFSIKLWSFYEPTTLHHSINSFPYCHPPRWVMGSSAPTPTCPESTWGWPSTSPGLRELPGRTFRDCLFKLGRSQMYGALEHYHPVDFPQMASSGYSCFNASDHGKHSPVPRKVSDHKDRWYFYAYKPWGIEESCEGFSPTKLWYRDQDSQYTLVLLLNS